MAFLSEPINVLKRSSVLEDRQECEIPNWIPVCPGTLFIYVLRLYARIKLINVRLKALCHASHAVVYAALVDTIRCPRKCAQMGHTLLQRY